MVALALLRVAAARPMATIKTLRRQATVVLAIDVSNSMAAKDAGPRALAVAKVVAPHSSNDQPSDGPHRCGRFGPAP